jgi:5-methylcytosine-specific restriction endonuclease McrA
MHTVCIACGQPAVPGGSRCPEHRWGNWERRRTTPGDYGDPLYLANRRRILASKPLCYWCGQRSATTADHLRAVAEGGGHEFENLVPACERCNRLRGASLGGQVAKKVRGPGQ